MTDKPNPLLDAVIKGACLADRLELKPACEWPKCGDHLSCTYLHDKVSFALRAFFDAAEQSPEVIEAMIEAHGNGPPVYQEDFGAAQDVLRALRAQVLGEE